METNFSIDVFLLNKFQKVSDWVQDYFGYDNFDIAKLCSIIMFILWIPRLVFNILSGLKGFDYFLLPFALIFCYALKRITARVALEVRNNPTFTNSLALKHHFLRKIIRFLFMVATIFLVSAFYEFKFTAITNIEKYKCLKEIFANAYDTFIFFAYVFSFLYTKTQKTK